MAVVSRNNHVGAMVIGDDCLLGTGTDTLSKEKRSQLMSSVRHKGTKPELVVRSVLHRMGYRFRLNRTGLPGTPDIILPKYRTVIFVHGCFWHRHPNCSKTTTPKQNADFWREKFERNMARDAQKVRDLETMRWRVVIIWECETSNTKELMDRLLVLLEGERPAFSNE